MRVGEIRIFYDVWGGALEVFAAVPMGQACQAPASHEVRGVEFGNCLGLLFGETGVQQPLHPPLVHLLEQLAEGLMAAGWEPPAARMVSAS